MIALTSDAIVGNVLYGATKGALDRLILASAHELGERGLRATVINPAGRHRVDGRANPGQSPEDATHRPARHPCRTANLVRFLLSHQGQWINGQLLHSNGGFPKGRAPDLTAST